MELTVKNEKQGTLETINFSGTTVQDLLTFLKINSETVLVVRDDTVITEDTLLSEKDSLEILSVVSGG